MIRRFNLKISKKEIEEIINEFKLEVFATKKVAFKNPFKAQLFKVDFKKLNNPLYKNLNFPEEVYILNLNEIREIASFPHLVGESLEKKCLKIGKAAALAISKLFLNKKENVLIYDILRAGPSYKIYEGFLYNGIKFKKIRIRPRYKLPSYRHHNGTSGQLEVLFKDFTNLNFKTSYTIIKPDTEASGGTSNIAIKELFKTASERKVKIKNIIFTGFISLYSLNRLQNLANNYKFKIQVLAWGNLTALYSNGYDMPLYGIDEAYFKENKTIKKLGGLIPYEILKDYLLSYPAGLDEVGDWSARQSYVDNGFNLEKGDILKHLKNSLKFIKSLYKISQKESWFKDWHRIIFEKEIKALKKTLKSRL